MAHPYLLAFDADPGLTGLVATVYDAAGVAIVSQPAATIFECGATTGCYLYRTAAMPDGHEGAVRVATDGGLTLAFAVVAPRESELVEEIAAGAIDASALASDAAVEIAAAVELAILNEGDLSPVLEAIRLKIETSDDDLTVGLIAAQVRVELATELARIDVLMSSRMVSYAQPTGFLAATFPVDVAGLASLSSAHGAESWATATGFSTATSILDLLDRIASIPAEVYGAHTEDHNGPGSFGSLLNVLALDVPACQVAILAKLLKYVQLLTRKDAAIAADNATELTAINTSGGSGAGTFAGTTDSLEAMRDRADESADILDGLALLGTVAAIPNPTAYAMNVGLETAFTGIAPDLVGLWITFLDGNRSPNATQILSATVNSTTSLSLTFGMLPSAPSAGDRVAISE